MKWIALVLILTLAAILITLATDGHENRSGATTQKAPDSAARPPEVAKQPPRVEHTPGEDDRSEESYAVRVFEQDRFPWARKGNDLHWRSSRICAVAVTNDRFEASLPQDLDLTYRRYLFVVNRDQCAPETFTWIPRTARWKAFELASHNRRAGWTVRGRVLDTDDAPIRAATVRLVVSGVPHVFLDGEPMFGGTTEADGSLTLTHRIPAGHWSVVLGGAARTPTPGLVEALRIPRPENEQELILRARRRSHIEVRLSRPSPLNLQWRMFASSTCYPVHKRPDETTVSVFGRPNLSTETVQFGFSSPIDDRGVLWSNEQYSWNSTATLDPPAVGGIRIRCVTRSGEPVTRGFIRVRRASGRSEGTVDGSSPTGVFEARSLPVGDYDLRLHPADGQSALSITTRVSVRAETIRDVTLTARTLLRVSARARQLSDGAPASEVAVQLIRSSRRELLEPLEGFRRMTGARLTGSPTVLANRKTDPTGLVGFELTDDGAHYFLRFSGKCIPLIYGPIQIHGDSNVLNIQLSRGATMHLTVEGRASGRLQLRRGKEVRIVSYRGGKAVASSLPPGRWEVFHLEKGLAQSPPAVALELRPGEQEARVDLRRYQLHDVQGSVLLADRAWTQRGVAFVPVGRRSRAGDSFDTATDAKGNFRIKLLAGSYLVQVGALDGSGPWWAYAGIVTIKGPSHLGAQRCFRYRLDHTLRDSVTNKPIPNTLVEISKPNWEVMRLKTDSQGRLRSEDGPFGAFQVRVVGDQRSGEGRAIRFGSGQAAQDVLVR